MNANKHIPFSVSAIFRTRRELQPGESNVVIIGSVPAFGRWVLKDAAFARRAGDNYWEIAVFLPHGSKVNWNWVTVDRWGGLVDREAMPIRPLCIEGDSLKINAPWSKPMEVRQLWPDEKRECIPSKKAVTFYEGDNSLKDNFLDIEDRSFLRPSLSYLDFAGGSYEEFRKQKCPPTNEFEAMREANRRQEHTSVAWTCSYGEEVCTAQSGVFREQEHRMGLSLASADIVWEKGMTVQTTSGNTIIC